uniref:Uncharacterized protein n=1 Tax=Oryza brachyantha TaxID=4533 RepID=J3LMZ6_ORYBR
MHHSYTRHVYAWLLTEMNEVVVCTIQRAPVQNLSNRQDFRPIVAVIFQVSRKIGSQWFQLKSRSLASCISVCQIS